MKALVTGAKGQLGQDVVSLFKRIRHGKSLGSQRRVKYYR